MDKKTIKLFEKERQYQTDALVKELLKGENISEARKHRNWLEISDALLEDCYETKNSVFWHLIIAFICLLSIGFIWACHIKTIQLSFEVISPNVNFKLSENWKLSKSFQISNLYINNLDSVLAPGINIIFSRINEGSVNLNQESATLVVNGNSIWLKELNLSKDTGIDLQLDNDKLVLYSKGKPLKGKLIAENAKVLLLKATEDEDEEEKIIKSFQGVETIRFTSSEVIPDPVIIKFKYHRPWEIRNFRAESIEFLKEFPPGSRKFESTIKSARIKLIETGKEFTLRKEDRLLIKNITTRRLECSQSKEGIKVFFEGSVSSILAGSPGYEKNLAPTYLEYYYHQKKLRFFWSAVIFLWGLLWSIKNVFWGNSLKR